MTTKLDAQRALINPTTGGPTGPRRRAIVPPAPTPAQVAARAQQKEYEAASWEDWRRRTLERVEARKKARRQGGPLAER